MSEKFNPADYMRTFTRKRKIRDARGQETWIEENHQYLDVKYRLLWFRQVHPEGFIDTIEAEVSETLARIEAVVYDRDPADGGRRLGKGRRQVLALDFKDYVEKCETQAIGRALAVAGFGTQFCDELDEGDSVADSPVVSNGASKRTPVQPVHEKIAPGKDLYKLAAQKGLSREDTNLVIQFKFQKDNANQLTSEELAEMLKGIQNTPKERLHEFLEKFKASVEQEFVA